MPFCFIDLDNFKPVNDRLGHAAGDDLLVEAARRMSVSVRAADTLARVGGDEFAALLTEVGSRAEVEEVAARIVADLARPFELKAGTAHISCSIGIGLFPEHGTNVEALQHSADAALYEVKEASRNAYRIYFNRRPADVVWHEPAAPFCHFGVGRGRPNRLRYQPWGLADGGAPRE